MDWQDELHTLVQSSSLIPTFDQWLDATGYRDYANRACTGPVNLQAAAMTALYNYYESEMQGRKK